MTTKLATIFRTDVWQSVRSRTRKEAITMRMPSAITRGLVLPLVLLGLLAAAPLAHAVLADHSGTICKNYNAGEVSYIDYLINGTRSLKGSTTAVICPLTRNTSNSNGAYIDVDITHSGTQTTTCYAYSSSYLGTQLAFASDSWTGSGFHELVLNLYGAGKSNVWSNYSVLCFIPGNANGLVLDLDLIEY